MTNDFLSFAQEICHTPFRVTQSRSLLHREDEPAFFPESSKPCYLPSSPASEIQNELSRLERPRFIPPAHEL